MNNSFTNLNRTGVYHHRGMHIKSEIPICRSLSDHNIIIGEINSFIQAKPKESSRRIVSHKLRHQNSQNIENFLLDNSQSLTIIDPNISIPVTQDPYPGSNIDLVEHWEALKKQEEAFFRQRNSTRSAELNRLLGSGKYDEDTFDKIGSLLQLKKRSVIYAPDNNLVSYVNGFKTLYKDNGMTKPFKNPYKVAITQILNELEPYTEHLKLTEKLFKPKTKAYDKYGFTQRWLWAIVNYNSTNRYDNIAKFKYIFNKLWSEDSLLFHNTSRMILFKKIEEPTDWTYFRPISIIPAWMAIFEKLITPVVKLVTKNHLSENQFGFKEDSSCNLAKMRIAYYAVKNGLNKILLIDLKKAFDSVNLTTLEAMIIEHLPQSSHIILRHIITLYKLLRIDLYDNNITPEVGIPQGASFSCLLFNLYIDPIIKDMCITFPNLKNQAFADDIEIQADQTNDLELALSTLSAKLQRIGMTINLNKCELISNNPDDQITIDGIAIKTVEYGKYLGQEIDCNGVPRISVNNKTFGKLMDILAKNQGIATSARIKIFKIYMRSKVNHLIPLICMTGKTEEFWKIIRKIIFNHILLKSTLPREAASLFRCGFFDIVIRPLMKQLIQCHNYHRDEEYQTYLSNALSKALITMKTIEIKHSPEVDKAIQNAVMGIHITLDEWELLMRDSVTTRLWNDTWQKSQIAEVKRIKLPGIIFLLSNAPSHILEELAGNLYTDPTNPNNQQLESLIAHTIRKYVIPVAYHIDFEPITLDDTTVDLDCPEALSELFILKQLTIEDRIRNLESKYQQYIDANASEIVFSITKEDALNKAKELALGLVSKFRDVMLSRNRNVDVEMELVIDIVNRPLNIYEAKAKKTSRKTSGDKQKRSRREGEEGRQQHED